MGTKEEKQRMRKINMKIFPTYKKLAWDYLFFYTIDFLFLTQVKNISAANVVLKNTFNAFFSIIFQIPANIIVEFLGKKNSIILGNILNCLYMVIIMLSRNLPDLIFAEFISAIAFAIKNIAEPSLLNESIPPSKFKGNIFSKLSTKGASGYYLINGVSKMIAGYLFGINKYLPIVCSLIILIIATILSLFFVEPIKSKKKGEEELTAKQQLLNIKEGFAFVLKSERLKALILSASLIVALLSILSNYSVSLLEELNVSSSNIGIIAAIGTLLSAYASKKQNIIQQKLKNKVLTTISIILSLSCIISGICGIKADNYTSLLCIVAIGQITYYIINGIYYTIIDKYFRNFTNKKIDTKIFATKNIFTGLSRVISGLFAAFLLDKTTTAYSMIIVGITFTILYILMAIYMKKRVGLRPEQYSKEERKYDELKV